MGGRRGLVLATLVALVSGDEVLEAMFDAGLAKTGQNSYYYSSHATAILDEIVGDSSGYNKYVPASNAFKADKSISEAGTDVAFEVRIYSVNAVDTKSGSMTVKVWLNMMWRDDRLKWNATRHDGVTSVVVPAGNDDRGLIWVPDLQLYNGEETVMNWEGPFDATLFSDGMVFYSRPGMLHVLCKYSGLVAFPFDRLKATMEFGSWSYPGTVLDIAPFDAKDGKYVTEQTVGRTTGTSYSQFRIHRLFGAKRDIYYNSSPIPYPVVQITIVLDRASQPGQEKGAKFPTSKAHISVVFHSFRLNFGRVIISRNGFEA